MQSKRINVFSRLWWFGVSPHRPLFGHVCMCVPINGSHFLHSSVCPAQPLLFTPIPERSVCTDVFALHIQASAIYTSSFSPPSLHQTDVWHVVLLAFSLNSPPWHSLHTKDIQMCCILSNSCTIFHYRRGPLWLRYSTPITFFLHTTCHLMYFRFYFLPSDPQLKYHVSRRQGFGLVSCRMPTD